MRRSRRTWAVLGIGLAATLATWGASAVLAAQGREFATKAVGDIGEILIIAAAAAFILFTASRWDPKDAVRRQWSLVGWAAVAFVVGDIVWAYYEVVQRVEPPYPGAPDIFYVLMYGFMGAGILWAGLAYRHAVPMRRPVAISGVLSLAVLALVGYFVVYPLATEDVSAAERAISVLYPVADVVLMIGPALFVLFMVRGLGAGKLARPWMAVSAGAVLIALADSGYALLQLHDAYQSGSPVDMGWMLGFSLIAMGASLARDAYGV